MTIEVRLLGPGDEDVLRSVADEVFDNPIDPDFAQEFLEDPRHHLAVAIEEGVVVGFASAVHYLHPDKAPQLWINEVGVAPTHRRLGLGKAVLEALFGVGRERRCTEAWVLTHRTNRAAMALYTSAGGAEEADDGPSEGVLGFSFKL